MSLPAMLTEMLCEERAGGGRGCYGWLATAPYFESHEGRFRGSAAYPARLEREARSENVALLRRHVVEPHLHGPGVVADEPEAFDHHDRIGRVVLRDPHALGCSPVGRVGG